MRIPAPGHADDIPEHCAGAAGDHADHLGQHRNGLFQRRIKQSLGAQLGLQRLKAHVQLARALLLHRLGIQLISSALRIQAGRTGQCHLHAVARLKVEIQRVLPEHHALHPCALVLEGKIQMSAHMPLKAGQFTAHLDAAQHRIARNHLADIFIELRDGDRPVSGHRLPLPSRCSPSAWRWSWGLRRPAPE